MLLIGSGSSIRKAASMLKRREWIDCFRRTFFRPGKNRFQLSAWTQARRMRYFQVERNFAVLAILVLAASVLASTLIAITVTKRGLRPLGQMAQSLGRIGPTHFNEYVAPAGWPRELQPLAIAFDDMLKRLDDSFTRLSQFSADLAHELRTPITNILGEAQVALT